jgi:hypothetical protein
MPVLKEGNKKAQVGTISVYSICRKTSLDSKILQKGIKAVGQGGRFQGRGTDLAEGNKKKPCSLKGSAGLNKLIPVFHSVVLAKFTQGFSRLATLLNTWFLVIFAPFELALDTVNLQFFLQLADCILKVSLYFYFNHEKSHPFQRWHVPSACLL